MFNRTKQGTIKVTTMKCAHCANRIEEALKAKKVKCKIDLNTKDVDLYFKDGTITIEEIKQIITDLGYEVA